MKKKLLPTKTLPMETKAPLPKIEKHDLTIGAFRQGKRLRMNETCMAIKLLFGHWGKNGLDDCWIDVIHDLLRKRGNVFTAPVGSHFHKNLRSIVLLKIFNPIPINFKRENSLEPALEKTKGSHVARRNGWLKCGSIERNRRYGGERNARAARELAPKGDMKNDRRKWEWPLQVAQGTGAGFWLALEMGKQANEVRIGLVGWGSAWMM